ncbi:hypothetical protein F443_17655 [Phytophthora nicotianae P1569]|uniref:Uncharacterized protein n=2 Tax=Phytophthora nicotianae TaxID=4792 RepID=V9ED10_PHYNI|nr:hypothetical protein F443_17655 [Phytophthora nicotianae P1569]
MSAANSSTSHPSSQPKDQLVLQIEDVPLAGRLLTIEIFEVQPQVRSAPSTPSASTSSARANGFRVAARDDVENEYSLFVTRQKAEYLYRAAYPAEAEGSEMITPEAMANGILTYLSIIGNRQRDVGKLVCREPEPHFEKKTRVLPSSTPPHKQRNPHLPSKRLDQRAVRVQKTSRRTMEAVAAAMRRSGPDLNRDDESEIESGKFDRKGSEASILHRMAVADSKTMWKAQLETNYEESDHPSLYESDSSAATQEYTLAPGLSPVKRALPERKTKHKDLEERRQKGRQQRIMLAQAAHECPNSMLESIQGQGSYQKLIEETEQESGQLSPDTARRASMVIVGSTEKPTHQPRASSAPRSSVGKLYSLRNLFDLNASEPEQFLRRRTLDTYRSVLGKDNWQDDIPGMEIEITDERPTLETPPNKLDALLSSARRVMVVNAVGGSLQRNAGTSRLAHEKRRGRTSTSPNIYAAALSTSHSAPRLGVSVPRDEGVKAENLGTNAAGPQLNDAVKSSPRSQTNLMSGFHQKQPDDQAIHQEDSPPPQVVDLSVAKGSRGGLQRRSRPRSNSVGCEGVLRLAPLPSAAPKVPVQDFLSPPEPETTPDECEVIQEKETSVTSPDPEVVTYSPNMSILANTKDVENPTSETLDKLSKADILRYQGVTDGIQATANTYLPPVAAKPAIDTEAQENLSLLVELAFPLTSQKEDFPRTSRQECWEEPSQSVIPPDIYDESGGISNNMADSVVANPAQTCVEDRSHEQQHIQAREDESEELTDTTTPVEEKGDAMDKEPFEQVEKVESAITDNQMQSCANFLRIDEENENQTKCLTENPSCANNDDNLDRYDADQRGENDMLVSPREASDTVNHPEISVDGSDAIQNDLSPHDNDAEKVEAPENSSPSDEKVKVMELSIDYKDEETANTMSFPPLVADSVNSTLFSRDQNYNESSIVSDHDADSSVPVDDIVQPIDGISLPTENILPYEELTSVGADADEDTAPFEENGRDPEHDKTMQNTFAESIEPDLIITTQPQKATDIEVEQFSTEKLSLADDNYPLLTLSSQQEEPILEAPPECEKPVAILRKKSMNPRKKSISTGKVKITSKGLGSTRRSSVEQVADAQVVVDQLPPKLERRHTAKDVNNSDLSKRMRRMSTINLSNPLPGLSSTTAVKTGAKVSAVKSLDPALRRTSKRQTPSIQQHSGVAQSGTNYHKKWGKWMAGKNIIEKVGCLQLEELVMTDPRNEENLLKLGFRYARSPDTSIPAILLLENDALLHKSATRTREYWFWLGSAHLDIFMRHRKYLPVARFHLNKSLRAFTSAFAYLESLMDPMLLLRYAIVLFWHKGDGNLEKTRDIFHELFSQFVSFCDKDRPNLLFLQFQVLHRLKLYVDAIDCINKILTLHENTKRQTGALLPSTNSIPVYDSADYRLMLMQCQQASGDYVSAAQSLASVLKDKNDQHDTTLKDEEYFDLWLSLAEKCFHHEDYALALEYYAIALNFAKQSQALAAIHYHLGLCFQSLGEDNKCVTEYKRARTANRHVPPLVSPTELNSPYEERFAQLLLKSVAQTVEEVRVELYGRAVRRLQRVFRRSRRNLNIKLDNSNSEAEVTKMPSLSKRKQSTVTTRELSVPVKIENTSDTTDNKKEETVPQNPVDLDDNQVGRREENPLVDIEHRHESFLARKKAAMEEMTELLTNPQYRGREASPSSRSNARLKATTQLRSGLLSPEKDRLDARRKQSMETYHQLGYVSSTMPWIEFWEKLLALAPELFESRQALYGSIARIRGRQPLVTDEVAFCALAESIGNVHEAAEKLHDASYERELTYVCAVIEVTKLLERDFPLDPMQLSLKPPRVSLPVISSSTADTIAAHGSHSPGTSRVVLPPTRVTSISKPKKHLRMNQMLDIHFQEHVQKQEAALAITEATGGFVPKHQRTEKLMVLQDFRLANNALLSSQLAFGSGKATI